MTPKFSNKGSSMTPKKILALQKHCITNTFAINKIEGEIRSNGSRL